MPNKNQIERPFTKVINVETGEETLELMNQQDFDNWLSQCEINTNANTGI